MMMTSSRPYLLRAVYDWILDNRLTPYLLIDANAPYLQTPPGCAAEDGKIVFNLNPLAITGLVMNNEAVEFRASFGGRMHHVYIPIAAALAIYASENGRGWLFGPEDAIGGLSSASIENQTADGGNSAPSSKPPKKDPPKFTIVK